MVCASSQKCSNMEIMELLMEKSCLYQSEKSTVGSWTIDTLTQFAKIYLVFLFLFLFLIIFNLHWIKLDSRQLYKQTLSRQADCDYWNKNIWGKQENLASLWAAWLHSLLTQAYLVFLSHTTLMHWSNMWQTPTDL